MNEILRFVMNHSRTKMNLEKITQEVVELSRKTALFVQKVTANFNKNSIEHKGLNDLVSHVDKQTEEKLVAGLKNILPEAGFIAEEGSAELSDNQRYTWIIDPVDGTTNYVHGLPVFAISIALYDTQTQELLSGVVHEINRAESFYAWKNGGAFLNEKPIRVSETKHLKDSLLATGFPYYDFDLMEKYIIILKELMKGSHGLRRMGAASVDLVYTACGRFEGFFEYNLKPWDVAAGALIVQEAGGRVGDFSGGNNFILGKELIAACDVFNELKDLIEKNWRSSCD